METYKSAIQRYSEESGRHFISPVRKKSHYTRGGWHLLDKTGAVIAIVGPDSVMYGNELAFYYNSLQQGVPNLTRA